MPYGKRPIIDKNTMPAIDINALTLDDRLPQNEKQSTSAMWALEVACKACKQNYTLTYTASKDTYTIAVSAMKFRGVGLRGLALAVKDALLHMDKVFDFLKDKSVHDASH